MPSRFFLPFLGLEPPVTGEHLHAALSRWFDGEPSAETAADHASVTKPYVFSPMREYRGQFGVEVGVLTDTAEQALLNHAGRVPVRVGRVTARTGQAVSLRRMSWDELASSNVRTWTVDFLTPTTFRTGNKSSPLPMPATILRAPSEAWHAFGERPLPPLTKAESAALRVTRINVQSLEYRVSRLTVNAVLGDVTIHCDDETVAPRVAALLQLAHFCGVGSFRAKGMGVVDVRPAA